MRPPSNSKHILYEELPMKGQSGEKLALRLGVSMPDCATNLGRLPRNWTWYAELAEYVPSLVRVQLMESG
jgi:hypothetical protein